ncbi:MAG: disulfide bond formation protein B [Alphaproteobacteria bacterium]
MTLAGIHIRDADAPLWAMVASVVALAAALGSQYLGGLAPCDLCLWQRVPHAAVIVIGIGALLWFQGPRERKLLTWLAAITFAIGAGIALYHVGVEQKWLSGLTTCSGPASLNAAQTIEELRTQLLGTGVVRCDEIPWELFSISIAGWNALFSLALMLFCGAAAARPVAPQTIEDRE